MWNFLQMYGEYTDGDTLRRVTLNVMGDGGLLNVAKAQTCLRLRKLQTLVVDEVPDDGAT